MNKIILFCFVISFNILAQQPGSQINYTSMKNITSFDTIGNTIWCGAEGGVFSFNQTDSSFFKLSKSEGLSSQSITSIAVDSQNKVWIGTQSGIINVYNPTDGSIKSILDIYNSDKSKKQINHLLISGDTVFVSTDFGLSLINSNSYDFIETIIKFGTLTSETKITNVTIDMQIIVNAQTGIAIQKSGATNLSAPESWNIYTFSSTTGVSSINKIIRFDNKIIVATNKGLFEIVGTSLSLYDLSGFNIIDMVAKGNVLYTLGSFDLIELNNGVYNPLYHTDNSVLKNIGLDKDNNILLGTNAGLAKFTDGTITLAFPEGPFNNSFQSIATDNNGNVWVATGRDSYGAGIFTFQNGEWNVYNKSNTPEIKLNDFHKIYVASDNTVYAANWGFGFTRIKNNVINSFDATNTSMVGIPGATNFLVVADIENDLNNNTWLLNYWPANKKVLSVLTKDSTWHHFDFAFSSLTNESTFEHLAIDQYNTKWFSIAKSQLGLYYFNESNTLDATTDDKWGVIKETDGLNSNSINCLTVDNRGELWVGTILGANIIRDPSNPKVGISSVFPLRLQSVVCIAVDPLNRKWVGTKQGVFLISSDGSSLIAQYDSKTSPLPSDDIKSITFDNSKGIVYIGTDYGLSAFYTTSVQPVESFNELFVYPNPLYLGDGNNTLVTIDGLIKDSSIKIFTISGKLIKEFASPGGRIAFWDGRDSENQFVASGIYLIVAYDNEANDVAVQKIAVIKN